MATLNKYLFVGFNLPNHILLGTAILEPEDSERKNYHWLIQKQLWIVCKEHFVLSKIILITSWILLKQDTMPWWYPRDFSETGMSLILTLYIQSLWVDDKNQLMRKYHNDICVWSCWKGCLHKMGTIFLSIDRKLYTPTICCPGGI